MSTPGGYGAPPYTTTPDPSQQRRTIYENAPITDVQPTGEFVVTLKTPPRVQAGMAAKFSASFVHNIDGACGQANNPWTTGPVVVLLDGNAVAVLSSYATIGTVTQDQSAPGSYFSVIQLSASCPPGNYVVDWSGTYTDSLLLFGTLATLGVIAALMAQRPRVLAN